ARAGVEQHHSRGIPRPRREARDPVIGQSEIEISEAHQKAAWNKEKFEFEDAARTASAAVTSGFIVATCCRRPRNPAPSSLSAMSAEAWSARRSIVLNPRLLSVSLPAARR